MTNLIPSTSLTLAPTLVPTVQPTASDEKEAGNQEESEVDVAAVIGGTRVGVAVLGAAAALTTYSRKIRADTVIRDQG